MSVRFFPALALVSLLLISCASTESTSQRRPRNPCYADSAPADSIWKTADVPDWVVGSYRQSPWRGGHEFLHVRPGGYWVQTSATGDPLEQGRYCAWQKRKGRIKLILDDPRRYEGHAFTVSENRSDTLSLGDWRKYN